MVKIVLVAHSRPLADALETFARQMAGEEVPIAIAAGSGDDGAEFGTNAEAIVEAITAGDPTDGVLVLVDVGSAIMSAQMALEMLPEEIRDHVRLCPAPFVEGTVAATVQAGLDVPLQEVYEEAATTLQQKIEQIGLDDEGLPRVPPAAARDEEPTAEPVEASLPNEHGLHARPAAQFVRTAGRFDATVRVENRTTGRGPVSATSISGVATLGAAQGHRLRLTATGPDAEAALDALQALVADGFGEPTGSELSTPDPDASPHPETAEADRSDASHPVGVVDGIAVGPAHLYRPSLPDLPEESDDDPETAWQALEAAVEAVRTALEQEESASTRAGQREAAGILEAQRLLLEDEAVFEDARRRVFDERRPAAQAWLDAVDRVATEYEELEDAYLQQRADDVRDVGRRVVHQLVGNAPTSRIEGPGTPFVLVAPHLVPSEVLALPRDSIRGVVCAGGNPSSHSAILLRSRGLPTVFGAGPDVLDIDDGTPLGLDGSTGELWVDPSDAVAQELRDEQTRQQQRRAAERKAAKASAATTDGCAVSVDANINHPLDAEAAADSGADGVGLLRTEFLFMDREEPPDEPTQIEQISTVAKALEGAPVTVRALDVGGDKPLRYAPQPEETNPFLGVRGIRLLLRTPSLFRSQLRALLQVAQHHPIRLLLPMVTTPSEVAETSNLLDDLRDDVGAADQDGALPLGIMVETPSTAIAARQFVDAVDFFSIGTNDLTQYTMAADREHADLAALSDALHPPVLRLIRHVAAVGSAHDTPVSVCGEVAADRLAVPILLGLGVDRLSVAPPSIPSVKAAVRELSLEAARSLANEALDLDDAASVRTRAEAFWENGSVA